MAEALLAGQRVAWRERRDAASDAAARLPQHLAALAPSAPPAVRLAHISLVQRSLRRQPTLAPSLALLLASALPPNLSHLSPLSRYALLALSRSLLRRLPEQDATRVPLEETLAPLLFDAVEQPSLLPLLAQLLGLVRPALAASVLARVVRTARLAPTPPPPSPWHASCLAPPLSASVAPLVPLVPRLVVLSPPLCTWLDANSAALSAAQLVRLAAGDDDALFRSFCALLRLRLAPSAPVAAAPWFRATLAESGPLNPHSLLAALARSQHSASSTALLIADLIVECNESALEFFLLYARLGLRLSPPLSPDERTAGRVLRLLAQRVQRAHTMQLVPFNAAPLIRALHRLLPSSS